MRLDFILKPDILACRGRSAERLSGYGHAFTLMLVMWAVMAAAPLLRAASTDSGDDYHRLGTAGLYGARTPEVPPGITLRQLKDHADSLHMSDSPGSRREAQVWYMQAMERPTDDYTPAEWGMLAGIYSNYASYLYYDENNSVLAFPHLLKAISIESEKCDDSFALCSAYVTLGRLYANYNNREKAMEVLKRGLRRNLAGGTPAKANYSFANLMIVAWSTGALNEIEKELTDIPRGIESRAPLEKYNRLLAGASSYFIRGDYRKSAGLLREAFEQMDSEYAPLSYLEATSLMLATTNLASGDYGEALAHIKKARQISDRNEDTDFYLQDWNDSLLESYYRLTGDHIMADRIDYISLRRRDSLYNSRNQTLINDFEQQHVTSALSADIKIANEHRQYVEMRLQAQKKILWTVCVGTAIIIALLLWLLVKRRKLKQCNEDLFRKNVETAVGSGRGQSRAVSADNDGKPAETAREKSEYENMCGIYASLVEFCSTRKEIFDPDFSLDTMCRLTGIKSRAISQSVNCVAGKNFSNFIAEFRVKEACRILLEYDREGSPTIEWLAEKVGFRSRPHFSGVFKTVTGMTCTQFIRQVRKGQG